MQILMPELKSRDTIGRLHMPQQYIFRKSFSCEQSPLLYIDLHQLFGSNLRPVGPQAAYKKADIPGGPSRVHSLPVAEGLVADHDLPALPAPDLPMFMIGQKRLNTFIV